jgi:uncharacterized protein
MVTSLYAGILAFGFIGLSIHVIKGRRKFRVAMGDAQNHEMLRRIRAHANFVEYSLFFIVLMALVEMNRFPAYGLHIIGIAFLIGRSMHAYSLLKDEVYVDGKITAMPRWRIRGIKTSFLCIAFLATVGIVQYFH